jgi:hypothetical protein
MGIRRKQAKKAQIRVRRNTGPTAMDALEGRSATREP